MSDWEQRKFSQVFERLKSYPLSRKVEEIKDTGFKYIHYGDIHTNVATKVYNQTEIPNITAGHYETLSKGDIILADASEDYQGIAKPAVILEKTDNKIIAGLHTIGLRPKKHDSLFLYYLINSNSFRKHGCKTGTGMKIFGITAQNVLKFETLYPSWEEQKKIGSLLNLIDSYINLHQRKINTLKNLKQQYLSLMFPKNNKNIPRLRFKQFEEAWEQGKLFENIKTIIDFRGKTPKKIGMEWSDTGYLALSALNVKNGYIDKTIEAKYGSEELYKKWMGEKHLFEGLVLFTTEAPMGNVALVPDNEKYILSQRTIAFDAKKNKMTNLFLATTLRTSIVQNKLISLSSGATAKGVSQKSLSALDITIPKNLEEQNNIGLIINAFDKNIKLFQRRLDILYKIKRLYLYKMFI